MFNSINSDNYDSQNLDNKNDAIKTPFCSFSDSQPDTQRLIVHEVKPRLFYYGTVGE